MFWRPAMQISLWFICCALIHSTVYAQRSSTRSPMAIANAALDGVIEPNVNTSVATAETGIVKENLVKLGDRVRAGQPLVRLDADRLHLEIASAIAESEFRGRLEAVEADFQLNKRKVEKIRELRQSNRASVNELEQAETEYKIAKGKLLAEHENNQIVLKQIEKLQLQLSTRTIVAPTDGVVVELHKQIGEFVANNSPTVVRLFDDSRLKARILMQPADLVRLPVDRRVQVELADGRMIPGEVEFVSPVADPESGCILIIVSFDNKEGKITCSKCRLIL